MITKEENRKVVVGISGGVDSSVAATLLKKMGFSPVGVFMRFWGKENRCCNPEAERRARKVCGILKIPFYAVDARKEFKKSVVEYFIESYKRGDTPNPCVVCNREVKFKFLMEKLNSLEADYIATGHYARLCREIRNSKFETRKCEHKLLRGKDKEKDQSYFLWNLDKRWLSKIIFPLGDFKKKEVRKIAEKNGLPTAKTEESQEVCFVEKSTSDFLEKNIPFSPGKIVDRKGNIIGEHKGLFYYTQGQRKRIGLPGGPYYVFKKETRKNTLVVTKKEEDISCKEVYYQKGNFFRKVTFPFQVKAQIRYKSRAETAVVEKGKVVFSSPQRAVTPGQSMVFYNGEELLGGGIIKE